MSLLPELLLVSHSLSYCKLLKFTPALQLDVVVLSFSINKVFWIVLLPPNHLSYATEFNQINNHLAFITILGYCVSFRSFKINLFISHL